jgi:3-(3-hydroxy-phenyl)propionate hydroxylase
VTDSIDQNGRVDFDVVISGAGPVGLTAALALGRAGRHVLVLEAQPEPVTQWRASTFHPPTLELAESLGFVQDMLEQGLVAPTYQLRERTGELISEFDFSAISDATRYPYRLQLEQYKYVRILLDKLSDQKTVEVRFANQLVDFTDSGSGVVARVATPEGEYTVTGQYLVGADGASSTVRKTLGVEFEGMTYEHRYLLLGLEAPLEEYFPGLSYVNYLSDPDEHVMLLRTPDCWRVMFGIPQGPTDEEAASDEFIQARLKALLGSRPMPEILSRQVYKVHQRVAKEFHRGNVVIMGDAAHVNSPIGGLGLNSGMHDAYTLGQTLLVPEGPDLASWADQRRQVALSDIQRITHRNTQDLSLSEGEARQARMRELREIAANPKRAKAWMLEAAMVTSAREQQLVPSGLVKANA